MSAEDVTARIRELQEQLRSDEQRVQQSIDSIHQRLEQLWGELATAPGERRAEIDRRAQRVESDLLVWEAMARCLAANRAMLDHASARFQDRHAVNPAPRTMG